MSAMLHREPNELLWRGMRPAHKGEQVCAHGEANNSTIVIWTVTAGKTLFMTGMWSMMITLNAANTEQFLVRDVGDVLYHVFCHSGNAPVATVTLSRSFPFPFEVPAGYDICLYSSVPNALIRGGFEGWEE